MSDYQSSHRRQNDTRRPDHAGPQSRDRRGAGAVPARLQEPARQGGRRGQGRLPGLGGHPDRAAPRARRKDGRGHRGQRRRTGAPPDQRAGQAARGRHRRGHGHGRLLPLSRFARTADARDREFRRPQRRGLSPPARRGRRHHSLELSAADPELQAAVGAARRQHAGRQARADHAAVDAALRRTRQGHPAEGRAQRHHRRQRPRRSP